MEKLQAEYAEKQEMDMLMQQIQLIQNKRNLLK